jgi:hypothetical protein
VPNTAATDAGGRAAVAGVVEAGVEAGHRLALTPGEPLEVVEVVGDLGGRRGHGSRRGLGVGVQEARVSGNAIAGSGTWNTIGRPVSG